MFNVQAKVVFFGVLLISFIGELKAEFTGTWEQELAYSTTSEGKRVQKNEALIVPQWSNSFEHFDLTTIGRIQLDTQGQLNSFQQNLPNESTLNEPLYRGQRNRINLRELYLDATWFDIDWRIGKQQVVWGQADGLKVLDQVNPQSFREFILDDFDDSRIPLWMVNVVYPFGDDSLQLLWIPDATGHELPPSESPYYFTSSLLIPQAPLDASGKPIVPVTLKEVQQTRRFFKDSDFGLKYSLFTDTGWDITLNYLYHYLDLPVLYQKPIGSGSDFHIEIQPRYERSHLLGSTFSNAFGSFTLRAEIAYSSDTYHLADTQKKEGVVSSEDVSSVVGVDYLGFEETMLSIQWFQSTLLRSVKLIKRDRTNQTLTLRAQRYFENQTWNLEAIVIMGLNQTEGLVRPKVSKQLTSELEFWLGADVFYGDEAGLYGQFDQQDRLIAGFEFGL